MNNGENSFWCSSYFDVYHVINVIIIKITNLSRHKQKLWECIKY